MIGSNFITISERAYKYIRQYTIKSVNDALIELITNANDAYRKDATLTNKQINIQITNPDTITVVDNAIGLTGEEMEKCFLQVGTYTADENTSRGFFSRGAKDISAIGNITFSAIKNGKYSECYLNTDAYGKMIVMDFDVTDEIRIEKGIWENGVCVEIKLLPNYQNVDVNLLKQSIAKTDVLRDILTDETINVTISGDRIQYRYPDGELILDMEYIIPNYPDYNAKFVVYKSNTAIPQPIKESEMEFGFLIKDTTTIYEVSTLDSRFRWNPYMNRVYGYIKSEGVHQMLIDYDKNGASQNNPYPIIDPSRITGINKEHPYIKSMFSIPLVRIDNILRELNKSISMNMVKISDMNDLMEELNKYGDNLLRNEKIQLTYVPSYDDKLIKAIQAERSKYVTYEKTYESNMEVTENEKDKYIQDEINKNESDLGSGSQYVYDEENRTVINISKLMGGDVVDSTENVVDVLPQDIIDILQKNPYIYKTSDDGKIKKLYVFSKGNLETHSPEQNTVMMERKKFQIVFIKDINIQNRYIYETEDGITIKINLNNPIVSKYLTSDITDIQDIKSTKSMLYMKEMITDVLADIILESENRKIKTVVDIDNYNNCKKLIDQRNTIITEIEQKVDTIFDKYTEKNVERKHKKIRNHIKKLLDNPDEGNKTLLYESLQNILDMTVE